MRAPLRCQVRRAERSSQAVRPRVIAIRSGPPAMVTKLVRGARRRDGRTQGGLGSVGGRREQPGHHPLGRVTVLVCAEARVRPSGGVPAGGASPVNQL